MTQPALAVVIATMAVCLLSCGDDDDLISTPGTVEGHLSETLPATNQVAFALQEWSRVADEVARIDREDMNAPPDDALQFEQDAESKGGGTTPTTRRVHVGPRVLSAYGSG
jgi:hypothetical protein